MLHKIGVLFNKTIKTLFKEGPFKLVSKTRKYLFFKINQNPKIRLYQSTTLSRRFKGIFHKDNKNKKNFFLKLPLTLIYFFIKSVLYYIYLPISKIVFFGLDKGNLSRLWEKSYQKWLEQNKLTQEAVNELKVEAEKLNYRPKISIVTPLYKTTIDLFQPLFDSVKYQIYDNWEFCLVDGGADNEVLDLIKNEKDKRIKLKKITNKGISGNTNEAINLATGEFVAFVDHDDLLTLDALYEVVKLLNSKPDSDLIYSDQDRIDSENQRYEPLFKPDWSPELFYSLNYLGHLVVVRSSLVREVGVLRSEYDGSQDYDLWLRIIEKTNKIVHLPKILYSWRTHAQSTTQDTKRALQTSDPAAKQALQDHFVRKGINVELISTGRATFHQVKFEIIDQPLVSIIIPFKDTPKLVKKCVESILKKTTYLNYEILLVSNNSVEKTTFELMESYKKIKNIRVFEYNHPYNHSALNNHFSKKYAKGEILLFLNSDTEVLNSEWLESMLEYAQEKEIGAVGALLLFPNKSIQHAGVVLGITGTSGHIFRTLSTEINTPFGFPYWVRNYLAVTAACLMVRKDVFEEVGGFSEKFVVGGNDVDLCLKIFESGYRNVYTPFAKLIHYEGVSRPEFPQSDYERSVKRYKPYLDGNDPYYNPNLSLEDEYCKIKI